MRFARVAMIVAGLTLSIGLVACGGDDDDGDDNGGAAGISPAATVAATQPPAGGETPEATTGAGAGAVAITATDFSFAPAAATAAAGDISVTLSNEGSAPHTLNLYEDDDFTTPIDGGETGQVSAGSEGDFEVTLEAGQYYFRCEVHPSQMQGALNVE